MEKTAILGGVIPRPPFILARDEAAQRMIARSLHTDTAKDPPVLVATEWPDNLDVNAVVVTPINILGTEGRTSFSIEGDLTDDERKFIDAFIKMKMAKGGGYISYRHVSSMLNWSRTKVSNTVRGLREKGIMISRRPSHGYDLDIGSWKPDPNKAKSIGLEIKEYI